MMGATAALIALVHRQATGRGQHIDLSHLEAGVALNFDAILEYTVARRVRGRLGNRHASMAPHGAYPCQGEDRWIVIAIGSDDEWSRLQAAMGYPAWASDERFATVLGRWELQAELDAHLARWTAQFEHRALAETLQAHGLAASAVLDAAELAQDPHLHARDFFEEVTHPEAGTHQYPSMPWKLSLTPGRIRFPAPRFGEHNEHILTNVLGMRPAEVRALEEAGVIAREPDPQGD
jgi:benzylsuccinate CoA-transferase BbsF subunit